MKVIYLTYRQSRIFRVFCVFAILLIEVISLILKPVTALKARAHATLFTIAVLFSGYSYLTGDKQGIIRAFVSFVTISLTIALVKFIRKRLEKLRLRLIPYTGVLPPNVYNFEDAAQPI